MQSCVDFGDLTRTCESRARDYLRLLQETALKAAKLPSDEFFKLKQDLVEANAWMRRARSDLRYHQRQCPVCRAETASGARVA